MGIRVVVFIIVFGWAALPLAAQDQPKYKLKVGKDEVPVVDLKPVKIESAALSAKERKAYMKRLKENERLRRNVRLVYPMAKSCAALINDVNSQLAVLDKKADRSKYMKRLEKELFQKYESTLRSMTVTQGGILIKLIYRETDNSAYQLIEEYKSWSTAAFWQLIARFFGANLKEDYDKEKEVVIEQIIKEIEAGESDDYFTVYNE